MTAGMLVSTCGTSCASICTVRCVHESSESGVHSWQALPQPSASASQRQIWSAPSRQNANEKAETKAAALCINLRTVRMIFTADSLSKRVVGRNV